MYDTILVPTDGSDGALAAADHAIDLAATVGATVHALYVVDVRMNPISTGMDREEVIALIEETSGKPTTEVLDRAEAAGVPAVASIELGVPHEVIREYAADKDVDLVVMGTHGRSGIDRALLGSVADRVVRTVDVPVLTVREPDRDRDSTAGG